MHEDQDILVNWTSHPEIMKIQKTNHFIFIYDGTVLVNPEYVLVAKKINLDDLERLLRELTILNEKYSKYCETLVPPLEQNSRNKWIIKYQDTNYRRDARKLCNRVYGNFPEVRSKQDLLQAIMSINETEKRFYSGTYFDKDTNSFLFDSDSTKVSENSLIKHLKNGLDISWYDNKTYEFQVMYYMITKDNQLDIEFDFE